MKILLVEFSPAKGHKQLFENICTMLSKNNVVEVMLPKGEEYSCAGADVSYLPYEIMNIQAKPRIYRSLVTILDSIKRMRIVAKVDKKNQYDCIISITYNEVAFGLGRFYFRDVEKIFLMHHNNLDSIANSKIKKMVFSTYVNKVRHIVQCRFISENMKKQYNIVPAKLLVWPHPLNSITEELSEIYLGNEIDCVGISNSNDENIINEIIQIEDTTQVIKGSNLHIVLRSKEREYDNGYLKVIRGFLSKKEYDAYIARGKIIFLPFPLKFYNRMSGTVIDAFSNYKTVIATPFELIKVCKKIYPQITRYYSLETFVDEVKALSMVEKDELRKQEFMRFLELHSSEYLSSNMHKQITASLRNEACDVVTDF